MVAIFLKHFVESYSSSAYKCLVVAQFHEWQASMFKICVSNSIRNEFEITILFEYLILGCHLNI